MLWKLSIIPVDTFLYLSVFKIGVQHFKIYFLESGFLLPWFQLDMP